MFITRSFSLTNFLIASSALAFQVSVLYPWHQKLDDDFKEMQEEQSRIMKIYEHQRMEELKGVKKALEELKASRSWWR